MKKYQKEIIKLTAREVLLSFVDIATPFFEASRMYRKSTRQYLEERKCERSQFTERVKYLRRRGYIETFVEGKEKFIELTPKGIYRLKDLSLDAIQIHRTSKWDGLWRVIIFDIPDKKKSNRQMFQRRLLKVGFEKIQESVYTYPFECTDEIKLISEYLSIKKHVLIMIADVIQGESDLVEKFLDRNILCKDDLSSIK